MKNKLHWKKRMITFAAAAVLTVGGTIYGSSVTAWATPASGTSVSDNIVVRQSAVDGVQIGSLTEGQAVSIEDETTGSDGYTWYEISFTVNGTEQTGWVRGDLLTTSDESLDTEDSDADETGTADSDDEESVSLVFETQSGTITLTDIPEEELALVSDRFVEASLDFSEGTITALQLAEPDELVSDDAAIVDFYYVYGSNEIGETGWYVYDADDGTIQKSLLNMQYSIPEAEDEETDVNAAFSLDSLTRMMISALGVICLLLLILAIAFSVRYRRLRRILEEELDDEDDEDLEIPEKKSAKKSEKKAEPKPEEKKRKKKKQEPEPAKVNKGQKPKEPVRAQEQAQKPVPEEELRLAEEYGQVAANSGQELYGQNETFSAQDAELSAEDVYGRNAENLEKNVHKRNPEPASDTTGMNKSGKTVAAEEKKQKVREDDVPERRKKKAKKQSSVKMEEITPEPTTEVMGVDIMDLDSMDDTDYEALLNRYLEEDLVAAEEDFTEDTFAEKNAAENVPDKRDAEMNAAGGNEVWKDSSAAADSAPVGRGAAENIDLPDDDYDIPPEDGADYDIPDAGESDIIDLSKLRMPDEEPEFYDDEDDDDDDLTFL